MADERTVEEIKAVIQDASDDDLLALSQDERVTVQEVVASERARRAQEQQAEAQAQVNEAGERERYEDNPDNFPSDEEFEPAPLSAPEVDPEEARKDDSSAMAHDQ